MIISIFFFGTIAGQGITQNIRGRVTDAWTKTGLPGANVVILNSDPVVGTVTDIDGYYEIRNIPIGRVSLRISFIGYKEKIFQNIQITSGKELVLDIKLMEDIKEMESVEVVAEENKLESINDMSTVSSRAFSVEETQRFAGARNDVARMASNFAGVSTANDANNDIVIRGNSPNGLLWRLEGIDIFNPNHFGGSGSTGGPVGMFNNNVLANSDFMTGAFPAEYGNSTSGVFDIKMRNGNSSNHEYLFQVGFNGLELGAEGPISRKNHASYLANYRYSTSGIFKLMGINIGTGAAVPEYQDLSLKVNIPTKSLGRFTVFGLGGLSSINFLDSQADPEVEELYSGNQPEDLYVKNKMGVLGISHTYLLGDKTFFHAIHSGSYVQDYTYLDSLDINNNLQPHFLYSRDTENYMYQTDLSLTHKFNARHKVKIGGNYRLLLFDMADQYYSSASDETRYITQFDGNTSFMRAYVEWQWRASDRLTINSGLNGQYLVLNGSNIIEPRVGAKYRIGQKHFVGLAYGLHSQMAPMDIYFSVSRDASGSDYNANRDLDFTKSNHYVVSYDFNLSNTARFKTELYYQDIYDAIVDASPSSYSVLNRSTFNDYHPDFLTNDGTARNYGVEFTLEKFMDRGFYGLLTTSIYESKYTASDGVERSTAFDGGYIINLISGKEIELGRNKTNAKKKKWITVDGKVSYGGGRRYTPADISQSMQSGELEYLESQAWSYQFSDYFRADVRIAFRWSGKKVTQEMAFDIQNVTNHKNPYLQEWNSSTNEVETIYQLGIFPIAQYRIEF